MDPDRWGNLRELFSEASELTPEEREEFLHVHCADDPEVHARLRALLEAHDRARLELPEPEEWRPDASADLAGSTIGNYRVLEPIGAGGMGRVYRAFDVRLERYVALKMLPDQVAEDQRWSARFKREARILASLSHANIAPIYDVEVHKGRLVLVLELVEGHTLAEHLSTGPLPTDEAIAIARQVAAALEAAHAAGVVHRDLKPANIAVAPDSSVKVLDFGIAKPLRGQPKPGQRTPTDELAATGPGQRMGTVSYMSPEMIRGLHVDARSDVWSYGVVLFEMLSAARPFAADNPADTMARILERPPDWEALPRGVPAHLRQLLERCLEKNPRQRLQAIGEARLALESASRHPAAGAAAHRSRVRRRVLWAAPALAVGAALLFWALPSDAPPEASAGRDVSRAWAPRQVSFTGDVIEAMIAPVGPLLATLRRVGSEQVVTVFDLTGGDPVDVARGRDLCCVTWSPDGSRIAFQRFDDPRASVHVVPALGGLERPLAEGVAWFLGLRWSPDGSRLATWAYNLGAVQTVDLASGALTWYIPEGVANGIRWIYDVDWGPTGQFAMIIQSQADDFEIHVMEGEGDDLGAADHPMGGVVTRVVVASTLLVADGRPLRGVRWAPQGEAVYYLRENGQSNDLFRIDLPPDSRRPQLVRQGLQIVEDRNDRNNLAISEDGVLSFASGQQYANLWHVPFDGSEPRALTTGTMSIRRPVVSPDGDRIAFEAASGAGYDIHLLDLEDGRIRKLTTMQADAVSPAWSPSGDSIAFVSAEGGTPRVWLVHAGGSEPSVFDVGPVADVLWRILEWAPGSDLLVQDPDLQFGRFHGQESRRPLTAFPGHLNDFVLGARYSPDGESVAIRWNRRGDRGIWVVGEGSEPRQLLEGNHHPIGWSPDGSSIFAYEPVDRQVVEIDAVSGRLQRTRTLPFAADQIDLDVARDGTGIIAAVREAPGDAVVVDLVGSR